MSVEQNETVEVTQHGDGMHQVKVTATIATPSGQTARMNHYAWVSSTMADCAEVVDAIRRRSIALMSAEAATWPDWTRCR